MLRYETNGDKVLIDDKNHTMAISSFSTIEEDYDYTITTYKVIDENINANELIILNAATKIPVFLYDDYFVIWSHKYSYDNFEIVTNPLFYNNNFIAFPELMLVPDKEEENYEYADLAAEATQLFLYWPILHVDNSELPKLTAIKGVVIENLNGNIDYFKAVDTGIVSKEPKELKFVGKSPNCKKVYRII